MWKFRGMVQKHNANPSSQTCKVFGIPCWERENKMQTLMLFRLSNEDQVHEWGVAFYLLWSSSCSVWQDEKQFVAASPNSLSFIEIEVSARPREAISAVSWRWRRGSLGGQNQLEDPLCYSRVHMKGLEEKVVLSGVWRVLACSGGGFNLKRCLWASLWGFSSFHICWLNVSFCLPLSGLWIKSVGSLLQSTRGIAAGEALRPSGVTSEGSRKNHFLFCIF